MRLGLLLLFVFGCENPCQALCVRMASYAEECGYEVSDGEVDDCVAAQEEPDAETKKTCNQYNGNASIRLEWTCDELEEYWGSEGDDDTDG